MEKANRLEDIVFSLVLLIFFAVTLICMDKLIGPFHPNVPFETSPSFFPEYLLSGILLLLVCLMVAQVLELKKTSSPSGVVGEEAEESFSPGILLKTVPLILLFIFSMDYLGFLVSGLLLLFSLQLILGNRTWWKIALFGGGIVFSCYLIFIKLLYIQLPRGAGIFEQLSFLFY